MKREDDEQLWDILGRAAQPEISPFFARNIVRKIRQQPRFVQRFPSWLTWRQLVPASALAAAVLTALVVTQHAGKPQNDSDTAAADVVAKIDPQDYEVVADLDDLLASEDNNLWDDTDNNSTL